MSSGKCRPFCFGLNVLTHIKARIMVALKGHANYFLAIGVPQLISGGPHIQRGGAYK